MAAGRCPPVFIGLVVALAALAPASLAAGKTGRGGVSRDVILASTTSTQDSGLLDALLPAFEEASGFHVKTIAVGSGQAIALGRIGEADVLLVHSPAAEESFMAAGAGSRRRLVMHNDFVIVGPRRDPAGVRGAGTAIEAMRRIAAAGASFFSRGDESGTHALEKGLWKSADLAPTGRSWYRETGLGMGLTLAVAAEKDGYTISDRGTWLAAGDTAALPILFEGDPLLKNVYHVIEVNAARFPKVNAAGARAFAEFLVSKDGQRRIGEFGVRQFGRPLFVPDAAADSLPGR